MHQKGLFFVSAMLKVNSADKLSRKIRFVDCNRNARFDLHIDLSHIRAIILNDRFTF